MGRDADWPEGLEVRRVPHTFRKTCATRLLVEMDPALERPWVIDEVQAKLGHTDRATTAKYYVAVKPETLPAPRSAPGVRTGWEPRPAETDRIATLADATETA